MCTAIAATKAPDFKIGMEPAAPSDRNPALSVPANQAVVDGVCAALRERAFDREACWLAMIEIVVAALRVLSGLFVLISALGFLCLPDFFLRMHPPALAYTFGSWCVTLASILYFSGLESRVTLHPWIIIIVLSITVPVTTLLLARAALFRRRAAGAPDTPPPLTPRGTDK